LMDFGMAIKDETDSSKVSDEIGKFLLPFLTYTLFDMPLDKIPEQAMKDGLIGLDYVLNLYGPKNIVRFIPPLAKNKKPIQDNVDIFVAALYNHSKVLENVKDGAKGLGKQELCTLIPMLFAIAGFQGTKALATTSLTQMPEEYQKLVVNDEPKLINAILECSRMDAPVTGAHQIVDDQDGLTTQIGKEEINFPEGTILFTGMTIANLDEERFENPYVFDPENRDFSKLTSFNAVGEKSYKPSPRICPGRNVAIMTVAKMIKAKYAA